jgi:hypothetical protein
LQGLLGALPRRNAWFVGHSVDVVEEFKARVVVDGCYNMATRIGNVSEVAASLGN